MLKKLKNLFIVDEGDGKPAAASPTPAKGKAEQPVRNTAAPSTQSAKSSTPETPRPSVPPSERFVNKLLEAIEANNEKGFDYLEFKQSMQNLGTVDMDDATRYQSALAMAKTMGASGPKLAKSAQGYIAILAAEEKKFRVAFGKQQTDRVAKRQESIKSYEKGIVDREARIKILQDEIVKLKTKLTELKTTTEKADAKVTATKDGFYSAYNIVVDQIKNDLAMIQKHS